jgi:tetratricopeptide (TPR) repeat protein
VAHVVEIGRQVAEAVHALHESGIVHRDIKPGNIFLTADDGRAVLMDLGLAQLADEAEGRLTRTRQFVGTLRYASPEQVLAVGPVDRRSDLYSLGATLWELLTLRPLFGATDQTPTPTLMLRIQSEDVERVRKYNPRVPADLEAIVLKCLEKDRARRYATAAELAADLARWQHGEPVQARSPTLGYLMGKYVRRHRAQAAVAAAVGTIVLASVVTAFVLVNAAREKAVQLASQMAQLADMEAEARREADRRRAEAEDLARQKDRLMEKEAQARRDADTQRQTAEHREAGARAVTKFYEENVLVAARPKGWEGGRGRDFSLREALDKAVTKIDAAFAGQPELEAAVRDAVGMTYYYLGKFDAANPQVEKARELRVKVLGPDHPDTLSTLHNLALVRWKQEKLDEAFKLGRLALEARRRVLGLEHEDSLWTQLNLGMFVADQGRLDEAQRLLGHGVEACMQTLGPNHQHTLYGQMGLGFVLRWNGRAPEAVALHRDTLARRWRVLGPDHPDTLRSIGDLAGSLADLGELQEAEALHRECLMARREILGPDHLETLWSEEGLAVVLRREKKIPEAEQWLRHAADIARRAFGPRHGDTLWILDTLAEVLAEQRKVDEAAAVYRELLDAHRSAPEPNQLGIALTLIDYGSLLSNNGRAGEAEKQLRDALMIREKKLEAGDWRIANTRSLLGRCLTRQKKFTEAEPLLVGSYEELSKANGAPPVRVSEALDAIIDLYKQSGKKELAEVWQKKRPAPKKE